MTRREPSAYQVRVELRFAQQRLSDLRDGVRSMRLARITEAARQRWYDKLEDAEEEVGRLAEELNELEAAERAAVEAAVAQRQAEIDAHLAAVYERQRKIVETAGRLAVFVSTKPEDWIEWNGELVASPRDLAEASGLDINVATDRIREWKDEPSFIGTFSAAVDRAREAEKIERMRHSNTQGALWKLDFDQIYLEDWG